MKRQHAYVIRCGSCQKRPATVTLPVSGLRRCQPCWDDLRGFCDLLSDAQEPSAITPHPAPSSQPTVFLSAFRRDWKLAQSGEGAA
jgi:hypothetical protein